MGTQNHRENQKNENNQDFRINDREPEPLILKSWLFSFLFVLDGFGYPLVLKSWFSCCFLFSRWLWLPIGSEILVFLCVWFSLWFWLSQSSSHLYRFGFPHGFTNSFCDQSCLKLHPIYLFISQSSSHLDAFGFHWFY